MPLKVGSVIMTEDRVRKPKTVYEKLAADDDGMLHEGVKLVVKEVLPTDSADICELYRLEDGTLLKIAAHPTDNDLVQNETEVLKRLVAPMKPDSTFRHYIPRTTKTLIHEGRAGIVLPFLDGYVSLADILRAYPKGIDFRDMAWMFKRLLVAVGYAHQQGFVHGAVLPTHVMVDPVGHGAVLIDWSYAVAKSSVMWVCPNITAMSTAYSAFYPLEVTGKRLPWHGTDIFMAAKCAIALLGGDTLALPDSVPAPIRTLLDGCVREGLRQRPQSAWDLHDEFDKTLQELVGKPTYRPFAMPAPSPAR